MPIQVINMLKNKVAILLFLIVILASTLRLWHLGSVPISLDWDEAALGYNAYSILHTGKDEFGKTLPVILQSFNDYKPALYAYLIAPLIPLFGLSEVAVRLPSALLGILTVLVTFFLVKELFADFKFQNKHIGMQIALLSSFLLAISPWHIQFSRVAFESNIGMALNVLGSFLFLKALKKPPLLILSAVVFALNLHVYQSEKVFTPLFVFLLTAIFYKKVFSLPRKYIAIAVACGLLIISPLFLYTLTNKEVFSRAQGVSFLSDKTPLLRDTVEKLTKDRENNDIVGLVFDNRRIVYFKTFFSGYLSHFDLNWLFLKGDFTINRHHAPDMGLLYLVELPFLIIGIYMLLFGEVNKKTKYFILLWLLLAPIPASISTGVPHAVRTLNFLPTFQIFVAIGIFISYLFISKKINEKPLRVFIYCFFASIAIFNFTYYLNQYFVQQNFFYASDWQYGYKELVAFIKPRMSQYQKIIVSSNGSFNQSYIFFLFHMQYDPKKYLESGGSSSDGSPVKNKKFANIEFGDINYKHGNEKKILLVGAPEDFPEEFKVLKQIYYPDMSVAMKVVEKE